MYICPVHRLNEYEWCNSSGLDNLPNEEQAEKVVKDLEKAHEKRRETR